jgi:hypothetical protein
MEVIDLGKVVVLKGDKDTINKVVNGAYHHLMMLKKHEGFLPPTEAETFKQLQEIVGIV